MNGTGSHRPGRRLQLRTVRLGVSTPVFAAVLTGTLFVGRPVIAGVANGIAMAQLLPSLLRWRDIAAGSAAMALFVAPLLVGATLLVGRGYCSTLCPLGTAQDLLMAAIRRPLRRRLRFRGPLPWLRTASFAAVLGSWLAGSSLLLALLEPYAIFHRGVRALEELFSTAPTPTTVTIELVAATLSLLLLLAVLVATALGGRIFCTTLCPAGTLLSVPARYSILRIRIVQSRCTACGRCERVCPAGCIDSRHRTVYSGSCLLCFDCLEVCPTGSLHYGPKREELPASGAGTVRIRTISENRSVRP